MAASAERVLLRAASASDGVQGQGSSRFRDRPLNSLEASAHGQQSYNGVEVGMAGRGKRPIVRPGDKPPRRNKKPRDPDWTEDEKSSLLINKLGYFMLCGIRSLGQATFKYDKSWPHYVAQFIDRNWKAIEQQWDSMLKSFNAVSHHESEIKVQGTSSSTHHIVSYWDMTDDQRSIANHERRSKVPKLEPLPRAFPRWWCELIVSMYQLKDATKKIPFWMRSFNQNSSGTESLPSSSTPLIDDRAITDLDNSSGEPNLGAIGSQASQDPQDSMGHTELAPFVTTSQDFQQPEDGMSNDHLNSVIATYVSKMVGDKWEEALNNSECLRSWKDEDRELELTLERDKLSLESDKVAVEHEKLVYKREKLAFERKKLAFEREKVVPLLSRDQGAPSMVNVALASGPDLEPGATWNDEQSLTRLQQQRPISFQVPTNQDFSTPQHSFPTQNQAGAPLNLGQILVSPDQPWNDEQSLALQKPNCFPMLTNQAVHQDSRPQYDTSLWKNVE